LGEKRAAVDLFEQNITNLIWVRIGKPFAKLITINFEDIEGKAVCAIVVNKAEQNAFYKKQENLLRSHELYNTRN